MNHLQAARILTDELKAKGYSCRLDNAHNHPRLYIGAGDAEHFVPLSSTAEYDHGNLLAMKRQDIARDVLPKLPAPQPPTKTANTEALPAALTSDRRVFGIKIFVMGRGSLVVQLPRNAIPQGKPCAEPFLTSDNHLYLVFSESSGVSPSDTKSETRAAYYFKRRDVQFSYAQKIEKGWKSPEFCARLRGDSLICDDPLPPALLTGKPKSTKCSLEDGKDLLALLNDWLDQAEKEGYGPKVSVKDGRVAIKIEVKTEQEL